VPAPTAPQRAERHRSRRGGARSRDADSGQRSRPRLACPSRGRPAAPVPASGVRPRNVPSGGRLRHHTARIRPGPSPRQGRVSTVVVITAVPAAPLLAGAASCAQRLPRTVYQSRVFTIVMDISMRTQARRDRRRKFNPAILPKASRAPTEHREVHLYLRRADARQSSNYLCESTRAGDLVPLSAGGTTWGSWARELRKPTSAGPRRPHPEEIDLPWERSRPRSGSRTPLSLSHLLAL